MFIMGAEINIFKINDYFVVTYMIVGKKVQFRADFPSDIYRTLEQIHTEVPFDRPFNYEGFDRGKANVHLKESIESYRVWLLERQKAVSEFDNFLVGLGKKLIDKRSAGSNL